MTIEVLAGKFEAPPDNVRREMQRKKVRGAKLFTEIDRGEASNA
jgi:hypothetical protein